MYKSIKWQLEQSITLIILDGLPVTQNENENEDGRIAELEETEAERWRRQNVILSDCSHRENCRKL